MKTIQTDAAYLQHCEDGPDRIDALLETSERLERDLLKSDYSTGWNAALAEARRQIQAFALQAGLDTQSSAAECDRIIQDLMA